MTEKLFNWQQQGWPKATVDRSVLGAELRAFTAAFGAVRKMLRKPQDMEVVARALADEAVKTSAIEGVSVDESVVMSSICRALGVAYAPKGFAKDARAEGVAQMMLSVREKWNRPITARLITSFHAALMNGEEGRVAVGSFRSHKEPMRVIRRHADGTVEVRYVAPPSAQVPKEIASFVKMWKKQVVRPADVAIRAAMLHPHFESIHPFEDGNGRVGRALVAKVIAEGLGLPIILPVSTIIARHRMAYYDEINEASRSLDWTNWAAFFIPVLTEMLTSFVSAARFVKAKRDYLAKYEGRMSDRAKKVILRMFEDGAEGVKAGLSAAKWIRMTKVSKATATRDLAELDASGAIIAVRGAGPVSSYRLDCSLCEPIDPLNDPLNASLEEHIVKIVARHPGVQLPFLASVESSLSKVTVKRALAALVKAGKVEHRGSKKTGGYYIVAGENPGFRQK